MKPALTTSQRTEFWRAGVCLFLLACACLGAVEVIGGKPLPELHPFYSPGWVAAYASGATLTIFALTGLAGMKSARVALAAHWAIAAVSTLTSAMQSPTELVSWVPVSKAALFSIAATVAAGLLAGRTLRLSVGLVLIFYGSIHLIHHGLVASLIPRWLPWADILPYFTGALMLVTGAALLAGRAVSEAAMVVAALFASWIAIIHSGRLAAHPTSNFEWTFCLSALALVGIAMMLVRPDPSLERPG